MPAITVKHNIEVAHRLYEMPGKCQNIHGHSMWVVLRITGSLDEHGVLEGLQFGDVKRRFRGFLDTSFDHHVLLNENDPWAKSFIPMVIASSGKLLNIDNGGPRQLPGLLSLPGDPTTENLSKWVAEWCRDEFKAAKGIQVIVHETSVNAAEYCI